MILKLIQATQKCKNWGKRLEKKGISQRKKEKKLNEWDLQIPRLPTGISYFVRIKVLGDENQVLVETPEIRARNEIVSIKCDAGKKKL